MRNIFLLFAVLTWVQCQKNEGDSCTDEYTNTSGRCSPLDKCQSAKNDFQQNGIRPTFCAYSAFGNSLVCCRDGTNILQGATTKSPDRPVWGSNNDNRRVCERKCEEYSRGVVEKVDYIPLLPDPETLSISAAKCDYTGVELIVGGENAMQGEFPHMAAIGWSNFEGGYSFFCGGSLISGKFVLTAGHCLQFRDTSVRDPAPVVVRLGDQNIGHCLQFRDTSVRDPAPVVVRLGDQNIDPSVKDGADPIDVPIRRSHKHPSYAPPSTYDDIALLELSSDVSFSAGIRPACLWTRGDFGPHSKAIATGWGVTDTDPRTKKTSKELQKVSLSLLENQYCDSLLLTIQNRNWRGFRDTQMCAGELRGGKDTCQGDSGSPLQVASKENHCIFHVVGVTSFGRRCAESGRPAIYTRVAAYLDWIESVVWPGL